jgi:putative transposase
MPRTARRLSNSGFYHVLARGHDRKPVFKDPEDYRSYLSHLSRFKRQFPCRCFHFCLMPNHVHLLMQSNSLDNLTALMRRVQQAYQFHWRRRYELVGHLWQGRFKSLPIEEDPYLLECARYIERNPVRAKLCETTVDYPWSSASAYLTGRWTWDFLDRSPAYTGLGTGEAIRRERYKRFVQEERAYDLLVDRQIEQLT